MNDKLFHTLGSLGIQVYELETHTVVVLRHPVAEHHPAPHCQTVRSSKLEAHLEIDPVSPRRQVPAGRHAQGRGGITAELNTTYRDIVHLGRQGLAIGCNHVSDELYANSRESSSFGWNH